MPAAGHLPKEQRMPGVDQDLFPAQADSSQQLDQGPDGKRLEPNDSRLHPSHRFANSGDQQEKHLGTRGINRVGITSAIDVRVNIQIAKECQVIIGWDVAVWIDSGGLNPSIPYVAEDIRREEGRGNE